MAEDHLAAHCGIKMLRPLITRSHLCLAALICGDGAKSKAHRKASKSYRSESHSEGLSVNRSCFAASMANKPVCYLHLQTAELGMQRLLLPPACGSCVFDQLYIPVSRLRSLRNTLVVRSMMAMRWRLRRRLDVEARLFK